MRERTVQHANGGDWVAPQEGSDRVVAAHPNAEGDACLEVVVVKGGSAPRLELRLLAWGRGLGWYPLRRIALDPKQALALRRSLVRAERHLDPRPADPAEPGCHIIPFPGLAAPEGDET